MPRYFFDTFDDEARRRDETGLEFSSLMDVRGQAVGTLPLMALDGLPDGDRHEFRIEVRDERGRTIFRAILSYRSEWPDDPIADERSSKQT